MHFPCFEPNTHTRVFKDAAFMLFILQIKHVKMVQEKLYVDQWPYTIKKISSQIEPLQDNLVLHANCANNAEWKTSFTDVES